ncbi:hypothetical protein [Rummeliibacillus suwonensis]|uniref:hypothetical protein n=1 Tax=Rummeliibacillus suwonensis TaxID=1306154 RepID=UPI001AB0051C|nr:hypothetical protein [Rummeliibacillus suwonensis]MBO2535231.1 hypothetical protein [Rummeliibacillus suwonensis]
MPKIPVKEIFKAVAPKVAKAAKDGTGDFIKKNPKVVIDGWNSIAKARKERFEKKQNHLQRQHSKYQNEILPKLDSYSYIQLTSYKREVESYIKQISQEEEQLVIGKHLHSKRSKSKSWKQILIHIEDKIKNRNYEEFLKAYNSPSYESNYLDAKVINDMRNIENKNELYKYIHRYTEGNMKDIERDFF